MKNYVFLVTRRLTEENILGPEFTGYIETINMSAAGRDEESARRACIESSLMIGIVTISIKRIK